MKGYGVRYLIVAVSFLFCAGSASALDYPFLHQVDHLAPRDEWGLLTQGPLNPTDFERRPNLRWCYYLEGRHTLLRDPAYVGALQDCLKRRGYYNGPIDGVYSGEIGYAIALLQKAHSMRVDGQLTVPVRRTLFLP
jgi:hypothetical protein